MIIKGVLRSFEVTLGLKINFFESRCETIGEEYIVVIMAKFFKCKILSFPFFYLKIPIDANWRRT